MVAHTLNEMAALVSNEMTGTSGYKERRELANTLHWHYTHPDHFVQIINVWMCASTVCQMLSMHMKAFRTIQFIRTPLRSRLPVS